MIYPFFGRVNCVSGQLAVGGVQKKSLLLKLLDVAVEVFLQVFVSVVAARRD